MRLDGSPHFINKIKNNTNKRLAAGLATKFSMISPLVFCIFVVSVPIIGSRCPNEHFQMFRYETFAF